MRTERSADLRAGRGRTADLLEAGPLKREILEVLRVRGGRLWMVDLVFELRWRGINAETLRTELDDLVDRGLVRGPLSQMLSHELTPEGWHFSRTP